MEREQERKDEQEMILVPRRPTQEMVDAAYGAAHSEDAEAVWEKMVERWLQSSRGNSDSESG